MSCKLFVRIGAQGRIQKIQKIPNENFTFQDMQNIALWVYS